MERATPGAIASKVVTKGLQDSEKVAVVPGCEKAFVVHTKFSVLLEAALDSFEEVHCDVPDDSEVLGGVARSDRAIVFTKPDVDPVELVFDSQVASGGRKSGLRREFVALGRAGPTSRNFCA